MPHLWDIVAYTYCADNYCGDCVIDKLDDRYDIPIANTVEDALYTIGYANGYDRDEEATYDSDDFPKVVFRDQLEDGEVCGKCGKELG